MPRPRIIVPSKMLRDAYESGGSLRTASSSLGLSRWAFRERCEELGVRVLDRDEVRRRKSVVAEPVERVFTETRRSRVVGGRGGTVVTRIERRSYAPCAWPACTKRRRHDALCGEHHRKAFVITSFAMAPRCVWPECRQDRDHLVRVCTYHRKIATGLLEVTT